MTAWFVGAVAWLIFFAVFEYAGFKWPKRFDTLSFTVAEIGKRWPFSIWMFGGICWGLAVHFFWPWCGNPLGPGGG